MKFNILNRWSGAVQFTAEIDCAEDAPTSIKIGLALKWGYESGAVLRGAVLRGAVLRGADLSGADLSGADLRGAVLSGAVLSGADLRGAVLSDAVLSRAVLSGAVLRGADLSGADLSGADLRGAVLSDADLSGADLSDAVLSRADLRRAVLRDADLSGADLENLDVPFIENIDAKILASIEANKAAGTNGLDMGTWHGSTNEPLNETNWCNTTHCRAGYAVCVAGKEGFELERALGGNTHMAAILLYRKSTPDAPTPDFFCSNEKAMADMKARAAKQIQVAS